AAAPEVLEDERLDDALRLAGSGLAEDMDMHRACAVGEVDGLPAVGQAEHDLLGGGGGRADERAEGGGQGRELIRFLLERQAGDPVAPAVHGGAELLQAEKEERDAEEAGEGDEDRREPVIEHGAAGGEIDVQDGYDGPVSGGQGAIPLLRQ